jgi:hypothetical protein
VVEAAAYSEVLPEADSLPSIVAAPETGAPIADAPPPVAAAAVLDSEVGGFAAVAANGVGFVAGIGVATVGDGSMDVDDTSAPLPPLPKPPSDPTGAPAVSTTPTPNTNPSLLTSSRTLTATSPAPAVGPDGASSPSLSPHALPFFLTHRSAGRSKFRRWEEESCAGNSDNDLAPSASCLSYLEATRRAMPPPLRGIRTRH